MCCTRIEWDMWCVYVHKGGRWSSAGWCMGCLYWRATRCLMLCREVLGRIAIAV